MRCERRAELLGDLQVAAVRAGRIGIRHADELLEMGLAAHADVVVDRHQENPTKAPSSPSDRTDALARMNSAASSSAQGASRKTPCPAPGMRRKVVRPAGSDAASSSAPGERERGVVLTREEQHRARDAADRFAQVELSRLGAGPVDRPLRVDAHARDHVGVERAAGVERQADVHVVGERRLGGIAEVPRRHFAGVRAAEPVELGDRALVHVAGDSADQHEPGGRSG